jgi:uncharacterized DUF497 family protein
MKKLAFHHDNLAKHGISEEEVEECFIPGKRRYIRRVGRRRYQMIAQTGAGRYLEVIYRDLPDSRFVFHAMPARPRDISLLKRRGKR